MKFGYCYLLLFLMSCTNELDIKYVKSHVWSYNGGFKIGNGDIVLFDEKEKLCEIKGDTIYYRGNPWAIIKHIDEKHYTMFITSISGKEKGSYSILGSHLK